MQWQFKQAKIISMDPDKQYLQSDTGERIDYDVLLVNIGSRNAGVTSTPGVFEYAICTRPLKSLMERMTAKESMIERRMRESEEITVRVVGGGVAGCELALCALARLKRREWSVKVSIITSQSTILSKEPPVFRQAMEDALKDRHIEIITEQRVCEVKEDSIVLMNLKKMKTSEHSTDASMNSELSSDLTLWATGAAPHCIDLGCLATSKGDFISVQKNLQSESHANVFGSGDCIDFMDFEEGFPPKAGVYAVREGPVLLNNLMSYLKKEPLKDYLPQSDFLRLANCGDGSGIGSKYGLCFKGAWVWKLKDWIDRSWMSKFDLSTLSEKDSLHFRPEVVTEEDSHTDPIKQAAQCLTLVDCPSDYIGFSQQWKTLIRMDKDHTFRNSVIDLIRSSEDSICK